MLLNDYPSRRLNSEAVGKNQPVILSLYGRLTFAIAMCLTSSGVSRAGNRSRREHPALSRVPTNEPRRLLRRHRRALRKSTANRPPISNRSEGMWPLIADMPCQTATCWLQKGGTGRSRLLQLEQHAPKKSSVDISTALRQRWPQRQAGADR